LTLQLPLFQGIAIKVFDLVTLHQQIHTQDEIPKVEVSGFSEMAADARERLLKSSSENVGDMTLQEAGQIKELNDIVPRRFLGKTILIDDTFVPLYFGSVAFWLIDFSLM